MLKWRRVVCVCVCVVTPEPPLKVAIMTTACIEQQREKAAECC